MFKNAWNLGTISGIKIRLHWTFVLLPLFIYFSSLMDGRGMTAAIASVVFVLAIFGCVLLHELGHAFAARQFGIGTRDIILLPIGGVASLENMPRNPFQELWIAVAGPLVNVVIATALWIGLQFSLLPLPAAMASFLTSLALVNVALVVFNMIPAFPMDGGRVFRSLLAMFLSYVRATKIAASVGMLCAIGLGLYGLFTGHLLLILLAAFVYVAGQSEKMMVIQQERYRKSGGPFAPPFSRYAKGTSSPQSFASSPRSSEAFGQREITVPSTLSGDSVAAWLANMHAEYCSVVESGRVIGRLTRTQLLAALSRGFGNLPVGQILTQQQN